MSDTTTTQVWTPYDLNPDRLYAKALVGAFYSWKDWEIAAKLRGIHPPTKKEREKALEALANGQPPPSKGPRKGGAPINLLPEHLDRIEMFAKSSDALAQNYLREIKKFVKKFKAGRWMMDQHGVAETMAGFILANFDPHKANRPSSYHRFAGLDVVPDERRGHSPHPVEGVKNTYSKKVRSKMLGVLGPSFLKACVRTPDLSSPKWTQAAIDKLLEKDWEWMDTVKGRKLVRGPYIKRYWHHQQYLRTRGDWDTAWGYAGCGKCTQKTKYGETVPKPYKDGECPSCGDTDGIRAGRDKHVMYTCLRVMVKQFLTDCWVEQRREENLPIPDMPTYIEQKRGRRHGE